MPLSSSAYTQIFGSSMELVCLVSNLCVTEHSVTWSKNGDILQTPNNAWINEGWLRWDNISEVDTGNYCCSVEWNSEVFTSCILIHAQGTANESDSSTIFIDNDDQYPVLNCTTNDSLQWMYNGIPVNQSSITNSLYLSDISQSNVFGIYQGFIQNSSTASLCLFRVLPYGRTNPPSSLSVKILPPFIATPVTFSLTWSQPSFTGGLEDSSIQYQITMEIKSWPSITETYTVFINAVNLTHDVLTIGYFNFFVKVMNSQNDIISESSDTFQISGKECSLYSPVPPLVTFSCDLYSPIVYWEKAATDPYPSMTGSHFQFFCQSSTGTTLYSDRYDSSVNEGVVAFNYSNLVENDVCIYSASGIREQCTGNAAVSGTCVITPVSHVSTSVISPESSIILTSVEITTSSILLTSTDLYTPSETTASQMTESSSSSSSSSSSTSYTNPELTTSIIMSSCLSCSTISSSSSSSSTSYTNPELTTSIIMSSCLSCSTISSSSSSTSYTNPEHITSIIMSSCLSCSTIPSSSSSVLSTQPVLSTTIIIVISVFVSVTFILSLLLMMCIVVTGRIWRKRSHYLRTEPYLYEHDIIGINIKIDDDVASVVTVTEQIKLQIENGSRSSAVDCENEFPSEEIHEVERHDEVELEDAETTKESELSDNESDMKTDLGLLKIPDSHTTVSGENLSHRTSSDSSTSCDTSSRRTSSNGYYSDSSSGSMDSGITSGHQDYDYVGSILYSKHKRKVDSSDGEVPLSILSARSRVSTILERNDDDECPQWSVTGTKSVIISRLSTDHEDKINLNFESTNTKTPGHSYENVDKTISCGTSLSSLNSRTQSSENPWLETDSEV